MQTVTFYSYKGGVGRSLAVANVARLLARIGKRVFVVDFDLEAPGQHYKLLNDEQRANMKPGFVDYTYEYFCGEGFRPLEDFVERLPRGQGERGEVLLMAAGNSVMAEYWSRLVKIGWHDRFYEDPHEGFLFLMEMKARIEEDFQPDILLIDARTGVTDLGSVAITLLPDAIVFLFVNNTESKEGTRELILSVARGCPEDRPRPRIVPVLTRIPDDYQQLPALLNALRAEFKAAADDGVVAPPFDDVLVLHSDRELEKEERVYLEQGSGRHETLLFREYVALFKALGIPLSDSENKQLEALVKGQDAEEQRGGGAIEDALQSAAEAVSQAVEAFGKEHPEYAKAVERYAVMLEQDGKFTDALEQWLALAALLPAEDVAARTDTARRLLMSAVHSERFDMVGKRLDAVIAAVEVHEGSEKAIELLQTIRVHYDAGPGKEHTTYSVVLRRLWTLLVAQRDHEKADEVISYAIGIFRQQHDEAHLDLADAEHAHAEVLIAQGDYANAEAPLRSAIQIFGALLDQDDARIIAARKDLVMVLRTLGRMREAESQRARIREKPRKLAPPEKLPDPIPRLSRSSSPIAKISVELDVVTPILGGAARARIIDEIDVVRVPSLRGQLRFWWRALYGGNLTSDQLYVAERNIFGGAADDDGGRSNVELRISKRTAREIDWTDVGFKSAGAYALWPAREARGKNPQPVAPRRAPGTRFTLEMSCPKEHELEIRNALRALILFGGYGSRTRRGTGSLFVAHAHQRREWLPLSATRAAIETLFGVDPLAPLSHAEPSDLPLLRGAGMRVGKPLKNAVDAWMEALGWLSEFRQGKESGARDRGADGSRPGRSNWPEADKIRHLSGKGPWAHPPQHDDTPAWPRAGFGLPIVGRFQDKDRNGGRYRSPEPADFELRWYDEEGNQHDRLASPLIVKALALADGTFVSCALWLYRGYPMGGEVGLKKDDHRAKASMAPFEQLVGPRENARFRPLEQARTADAGFRLRTAFFSWLDASRKTTVVAP